MPDLIPMPVPIPTTVSRPIPSRSVRWRYCIWSLRPLRVINKRTGDQVLGSVLVPSWPPLLRCVGGFLLALIKAAWPVSSSFLYLLPGRKLYLFNCVGWGVQGETSETVINVGWGLERIRLSVYLNFPRMYRAFGGGWLVFMPIIRAHGIPLSRVIRRFAIFAYRHLRPGLGFRFGYIPSTAPPPKDWAEFYCCLWEIGFVSVAHIHIYTHTHKPTPTRTVYGNSYLKDIKVRSTNAREHHSAVQNSR